MLFSDSFYTIAKTSSSIFKDRGSKFISYAYPVSTESEIKAHLADLKKNHVGANHFCYAYCLGAGKEAYRVNDDGEPSSTAGKPIYSQIQSNQLTNILVVVVRYFGGTLLGVSGLINAYKTASMMAIGENEIIEQFITYEYKIDFEISDMNNIMKIFKDLEITIIKQAYFENYCIHFHVKKLFINTLEEKIEHLYNSKLTFIKSV